MHSFTHIASLLENYQSYKKERVIISKKALEYCIRDYTKELSFNLLKNISLGQYIEKRFDLKDFILAKFADNMSALRYLYYAGYIAASYLDYEEYEEEIHRLLHGCS
jgi:hypothetical protein